MNPIKAELFIATLVVSLALIASAVIVALYWRGEAYQAREERDNARTQVAILADSVKSCSAGVDAVKKASAAAMTFGQAALAEIRRRNAPLTGQIARLEELIKNPPQGATCDDAWKQIESTAGSQR